MIENAQPIDELTPNLDVMEGYAWSKEVELCLEKYYSLLDTSLEGISLKVGHFLVLHISLNTNPLSLCLHVRA